MLKTIALKFAYYFLTLAPLGFLIWGKQQIYYCIAAATFVYIAAYFLKKEIKKLLAANA